MYTLSTIAKIVDAHPRQIMYYEKMGLVTPDRDEYGRRLFSQEHLERINLIRHYTQNLHVNLAGVKLLLEEKGEI